MTKKILILESSPRKKGNTAVLAACAAKAILEDSVEVETIHLHGMSIAPCNHCDGCIRKKVFCLQQDDMQSIYPKLAKTDGLILASPIYWSTFNAQLKICIDRWYGLWQNQNDFLKGKPVGIILCYGDSDIYVSGGINAIHTLESMLRFLETGPLNFAYGSLSDVGDAEKNPELMESARQLGKKMSNLVD